VGTIPTWPPSIQMGVTAGIFLASIQLLKEMRYLVYIRYLWSGTTKNLELSPPAVARPRLAVFKAKTRDGLETEQKSL
jgi:hypothetical protein